MEEGKGEGVVESIRSEAPAEAAPTRRDYLLAARRRDRRHRYNVVVELGAYGLLQAGQVAAPLDRHRRFARFEEGFAAGGPVLGLLLGLRDSIAVEHGVDHQGPGLEGSWRVERRLRLCEGGHTVCLEHGVVLGLPVRSFTNTVLRLRGPGSHIKSRGI